MKEYYVPKTGLIFFDIARAYGLGIVGYAIADDPDVIVEDRGIAYKVTVKSDIDVENTEQIQSYLFSDTSHSQYWEHILKTSNVKNKLKEETIGFFKSPKNVEKLLEKHSKLSTFDTWIFESEKRKTTEKRSKKLQIPQSLELGAGKGIRSIVPSTLTEKGLELPGEHRDQLYLAILGALNASVYSFQKLGSTTYTYIVYPVPGRIEIEYIVTRAITTELREALTKSHRAGLLPTLAYIAVEIEIARKTSFIEEQTLIPSLAYGVMARSPQAKDKPYATGKFPMDLVSKIPSEILFFWRNILRNTRKKKGYEDIAIALSKLIAEPTLENYYSYIKLHLRNELKSDSIKFGFYEKNSLLEVLKNVETC